MPSKGVRSRRNKKRALFIAQQGRCWLCGGRMDWYEGGGRPPPNAATLDHIKPKSQGGTYSTYNLQLAHSRCNALRGDREDVRAIDVAHCGL